MSNLVSPVKYRSLTMSLPMVQAMLVEQKTQSRRPVRSLLPPCRTGEQVWVREPWRLCLIDGRPAVQYQADGAKKFEPHWDRPTARAMRCRLDGVSIGRWMPGRFMPCWAARLWLRIQDVREERLRDISDQEIRAEGFNVDIAFDIAAPWVERVPPVCHASGDGPFCPGCVKKNTAVKVDWRGLHTPPQDSLTYCKACGALLRAGCTDTGYAHYTGQALDALTVQESSLLLLLAPPSCQSVLLRPIFRHFWDQTYTDDPFQWEANPIVWVIEFDMVEAPDA